MAEEKTTEESAAEPGSTESVEKIDSAEPSEGPSFEDIANEASADQEEANAAEVDESDVEAQPVKPEPKPRVKPSPWIDFKTIDLQEDLRNLYRKPFWIVVTLLAILILALFILLFVEYLKDERYKALKGYVSTQHKVPEWYKDPLPADVKEILDEYHHKREHELALLRLEPDDPHEKDPVMGDFYPEVLTNEDVILVLEEQNIGAITPRGAEQPEKMNLSGLNLTKINFQYLNNFVQSNLRYTNFTGVRASGLIFRGASLQNAIFVDAVIPGANFTRSRLDYSNFFSADVRGSIFTGAIGQKALLAETNLSESNFDEGIFKLADFSNAILDGSTAKYAYFEGANFRDASLIGVNFKGAILRGVSLVNANLSGANLTGASLEGANLEGANLDGAILKDADLTLVDFKNAQNLTKAQIESSKTVLDIKNLPKSVFPQRQSWNERFTPPREVF